ncbi:MAG: helix-turn-helix domain-containing protein [Polyangia bacterium]
MRFSDGVALNHPTELRRRVGARIAELRGSRGWTQEQFAERLEVGGIRFHGLRAREVWALNRFFPG